MNTFKITPTKSFFTKRTFQEFVNPDSIRKLLTSEVLCDDWNGANGTKTIQYTNERTHLQAILDNISPRIAEPGMSPVEYNPVIEDVGRVYPTRALSIGTLRKPVRHYIAKDHYTDVDITNCHPVLAIQYFEKAGIPLPALKAYVDNREIVLEQTSKACDISRDVAKNLYIRIMYGGSFRAWCEDHGVDASVLSPEQMTGITAFENDAKTMIQTIAEANPEMIQHFKNKGKRNPSSSVASTFFQNKERVILETIFTTLVRKGLVPKKSGDSKMVYNAILCFDGLMFPKGSRDADIESALRLCEKAVLKKHEVSISLVIKPMTDGYTDAQVAVQAQLGEPKPTEPFDRFEMMDKAVRCDEEIETKMEGSTDLNANALKRVNSEIERMKMDHYTRSYEAMKPYFEEHHFKLEAPASFIRVFPDRFAILSQADLKTNYNNIYLPYGNDVPLKTRWADAWMDDPYIRTYSRMDFYPPPLVCPKGVYNTFTPFAIVDQPSTDAELPLMIATHLNTLAGGDSKGVEYMLDWFAHMVQKPGEIPRVAIVFKSVPGVGKNAFFSKFAEAVLGTQYYKETSNLDDLLGTFPSHFYKILVAVDECNGKETFLANDRIKSLITAPKITKNEKNVKAFDVNHAGRYVFFSNNDTPIKIELGDRRFVVFECLGENANNPEYFDALFKELDDAVVMRKFYDYLMSRDISKWDSIRSRPISDYYKELQQVNVPLVHRFLNSFMNAEIPQMECGEPANIREKVYPVDSSYCYKEFRKWCVSTGHAVRNGECSVSMTKFGRDMNRVQGVEKTRHRKRGIVYNLTPFVIRKYSPLIE